MLSESIREKDHPDSLRTANLLSDMFDKPLEERIRSRAYELYVQRGRGDNRAEQDWYDAEEERLANR